MKLAVSSDCDDTCFYVRVSVDKGDNISVRKMTNWFYQFAQTPVFWYITHEATSKKRRATYMKRTKIGCGKPNGHGLARLIAGVSCVLAMAASTAFAIDGFIPTEGLQFHLDAGNAGSLAYDAGTLQVASWQSDSGDGRIFNANSAGTESLRPHYVADAFGAGRPGVLFGYKDDGSTLIAEDGTCKQYVSTSVASTNRTLVYVVKTLASVSCMEIVGPWGVDCGIRLNNTSGSHYNDGFNSGGWGYVNGFNWLVPSGGSPYPSSGDPACFDTQVCIDVRPDDATDIDLVKISSGVFSAGTVFKVGVGWYDAIGGTTYNKRFYRGYVGEVFSYNRRLDGEERDLLTARLMQKWCPEKVCWWVGGSTGDWANSANWKYGVVPTATSVACITNQTLAVTGCVSAGILLLDDSHLVMSEGSELGSVSICKSGASSISFSGVVRFDVAAGATSYVQVPLTGATSLLKTGKGMLTFAGDDILQGLPVTCKDGAIDLNGTRQTFTSVLADYSYVTNTAARNGTMVLSAAAGTTNDVEAAIWGGIDIEKTGAGATRLPSLSSISGKLVLSGGTVIEGPAFVPADLLPGIGLHLDASRPETLTTNSEGYVSQWNDAGARVIRNYDQYAKSDTEKQPYYDASAANGMGGVIFGQTSDSATARESSLTARLSISNVTVFIVETMFPNQRCGEITRGQKGSLPGIFGNGASDNGIRFTGSNDNGWKIEGTKSLFVGYSADGDSGQIYQNGLKVIDGTKGLTENVSTVTGVPTLVTAVVHPEKLSIPYTTARYTDYFTPSIGQYYTTYPRFWTGAIHEVIVFQRYLTARELSAVQSGLMKKWGVQPDAVMTVTNAFAASELEVKADSSLDVSASPASAPERISLAAYPSSAYPILSLLGGWDLTSTVLNLADGGQNPQKLVVSDGLIVGPLAGVEPSAMSGKVRCGARSVYIPSGSVIVVW